MSQEEVIEVLKKHQSQWLSSKQIRKFLEQEGISISSNTVARNLSRLRRRDEIEKKIVARNGCLYTLKC